MLIINGNFIEITEDYLKKFKVQIEQYESSLGKEELVSEKQQIKNEFIDTVVENSMIDNSIDKITRSLQLKADYISEEHRRKTIKSKRKEKRKIKAAKTFKNVGEVFRSKSLLELSIKKYKEVISNRNLLEQELDNDWQQLDSYTRASAEMIQSFLEEMIDETVITERMHTTEVDMRRTNEELENVLGEQILGEAIQDRHGIGNLFQRLLHRFSKKDEREDR